MTRRRLLHTAILLVGLAGLALAIASSVSDVQEQVLPSAWALAVAAVLALAAIMASARTWVALFNDVLDTRANRHVLRGTFYLSQITKYVPAGGVVQAASQLSLAPSAGVPLGRVAVSFPVSAMSAVAAGATIGSGVALDSSLPGWTRALALCGLATPVLLRRQTMARVLELARRVVHRIPHPDRLPSQRDIFASYAWALATLAFFSAAYAILLGSLHTGANPAMVFCAFSLSWVIGFLALPIPAGVGVREALLVGLLPGVGTAPLLAASLALRLLGIATEVLAIVGNRIALRRGGIPATPGPPAEQLTTP